MKVIFALFFSISLIGCKSDGVELTVNEISYLSLDQVTSRGLNDYKEHNDLIRLSVATNYDIDNVRKDNGDMTQFYVYKCRDVSPDELINSGDYESVLSVKKLESNYVEQDVSSFLSYEIVSTLTKSESRNSAKTNVVDVCVFSRLLNMVWIKSISGVNKISLNHLD